MGDPVETANEQISDAQEERGDRDPWPRWMAMVVSVLAASLALSELGAKSGQTEYLTHNIVASDTWSAYQAKNLRANLWESQAALLLSLPNAGDAAIQDRVKQARAEAARMRDEPSSGDGMKQLQAKARDQERERDVAFHSYHGFEHTSSVLQITIVLASASVITRTRGLGVAAGCIGLLACGYGIAVLANLV